LNRCRLLVADTPRNWRLRGEAQRRSRRPREDVVRVALQLVDGGDDEQTREDTPEGS
jgi:hypothetical protein